MSLRVWGRSLVMRHFNRFPDIETRNCSFVLRRRLQNVFKTSWSVWVNSSLSYIFNTSSSRLQDIFKTPSRCTTEDKLVLLTRLQQVFKMFCEKEYLQKDTPWPQFLRNLWSWYKFSKSGLVWYTEFFRVVFINHYVITVFNINIFVVSRALENILLSQLIKNQWIKASLKMYVKGFSPF